MFTMFTLAIDIEGEREREDADLSLISIVH
jgi:hypothetical protein